MKRINTHAVVLVSLVAVFGSTAAFAAAAKRQTTGARDKAVAECIALAKSQAPLSQLNAGTGADPSDPAVIRYKTCMQQKGLRP